MSHDVGVNDVFEHLTADAVQADGPVIVSFKPLTLLVNRRDVSCLPHLRDPSCIETLLIDIAEERGYHF